MVDRRADLATAVAILTTTITALFHQLGHREDVGVFVRAALRTAVWALIDLGELSPDDTDGEDLEAACKRLLDRGKEAAMSAQEKAGQ